MKPSVLLVDDHALLREGLQSLIDKFDTATVIGQAADGIEAVRLAEELKPDLVIMDLTMPVMNGIEATKKILGHDSSIKILALSMEQDRFYIVEVLKAGATGYLLKDTVFQEMEEAITTVVNGGTYLPQKISTILVKDFLQAIPQDIMLVYQGLTTREREILQMVADGKCTKEIAHDLQISIKTVENMRHVIMNKLGIFSIAELTKFAIRHGLTSLTK